MANDSFITRTPDGPSKKASTLAEAWLYPRPQGRNVVARKRFGAPQNHQFGRVTIGQEIELEDHIEEHGVALITSGRFQNNDAAG